MRRQPNGPAKTTPRAGRELISRSNQRPSSARRNCAFTTPWSENLATIDATRSSRGWRETICWRPVPSLVRAAYLSISPFTARMGKRSEEHTSELQSLMRISYAVFCLKKKRDKLLYTDLQHNIYTPQILTNT